MSTITIQGWVHDANGNVVTGATVSLYSHIDGVPGGAPLSSTSTDANGKFSIGSVTPGQYDVKITNGTQTYWWKGMVDMTFGDIYTASLTLTNGTSSTNQGTLGFNSGQVNVGDGAANHILIDADSAQGLTNKTLTSPTINSPSIAGTVTGSATYAAPTFSGAIAGFKNFSGVPTFRGTSSVVNWTLPTSTWQVLNMDTERYKVDIGHSNSSNKSQMVATTSGVYRIGGVVTFTVGAVTNDRGIKVRINNTTDVNAIILPAQINASFGTVMSINTEWYMNAADYAEILVWQDSGGTLTMPGGTTPVNNDCWMSRVGNNT